MQKLVWSLAAISILGSAAWAQDCAGAPSYTSAGLEARDAAECSLVEAPACQRIRPASTNAIFIGTVLSIRESDGRTVLNGECAKTLLQTVTVKVGESFVGNASGTVTIKAGDINGFYFRRHERFLIFARLQAGGTFEVTSCGGTKKLHDAANDVDYLRSWASRPQGADLFGQAWIRVDKDHPEHMVGFLGRGLTGAKVSVLGPKAVNLVTDKLGHYEVPNLPHGKYEVSIDVPFATYPAKSQTVDLVERGCAEVNFHVDPFSTQSENSLQKK
jgi:hypothetical protein